MKRSEKEQLVTELSDKLKNAQSLYYTDFTGLNVKRMTELRRRLKRAGVDYVVIKNTLAQSTRAVSSEHRSRVQPASSSERIRSRPRECSPSSRRSSRTSPP